MPSATSTTRDSPLALTLPRSSFAKISPGPFLAAHLGKSPPLRPNGRAHTQFRAAACTTGSLNHCIGSAVVRLGDTAVVCGIRAEVLPLDSVPNLSRANEETCGEDTITAMGLLVPNVELATGCSHTHLPGGAPTAEAQTLVQRLRRTVLDSKLVDLEDLRITKTFKGDDSMDSTETIAYWTLFAAIHVISLSGSHSLFDAAWAALLAGLHDVKLPHAWWDTDAEIIVCSEQVAESRGLCLRGRPVACTWGLFVAKNARQGESDTNPRREQRPSWLLADPDGFEDQLCDEFVTVTVDCSAGNGTIKRIEKKGGTKVGKKLLKELCEAAEYRWDEWNQILPL